MISLQTVIFVDFSENLVDDRKGRSRKEGELPRLSDQLQLDEMWQTLGDCLTELAKTPDHHAVLILQPAVEAFFLVHAGKFSSQQFH